MKRSEIQSCPEYYLRYIKLAPDEDLVKLLPKAGLDLFIDNRQLLDQIGQKVYAEGKWTIHQIIEHLIDTERIFLYRSLRFARNDKTDLPGYDENDYAAVARSNERTLEDLLREYELVRQSSVHFFRNLNKGELLAEGTANGQKISVLAMGFILIGHPIHHFNTIKERYAPLVV